MTSIPIGTFTYTKDELNNWIWKATDTAPLTRKGEVKYAEKPLYPLQEMIEENSLNNFKKIANDTALDLVKFLKEQI